MKAQKSSVYDVARNGSLVEIKELVNNDSDIINKTSKEGYSALTLACYYGNNEVASYLIQNVNNINLTSGYGTPLMAASVKKNNYLVKLLLENNANPNLTDQNKLNKIINKYKPQGIFNLAAETHVDRSIDGPKEFINSNIIGVFNLLEVFKNYLLTTNKTQVSMERAYKDIVSSDITNLHLYVMLGLYYQAVQSL